MFCRFVGGDLHFQDIVAGQDILDGAQTEFIGIGVKLAGMPGVFPHQMFRRPPLGEGLTGVFPDFVEEDAQKQHP